MSNFPEIIKKLNEDYALAVQKGAGERYSLLSTMFTELGDYLRECIQGMTTTEIKGIINKLKKGILLTSQEQENLKLWMVGDADYYVRLENNYTDWQNELKRLMGEINALDLKAPDIVDLSKLRGLLQDAMRTVADILFYIQQKERVSLFEEASTVIDAEERDILIRLLEQKLNSSQF
jgi:hypothetical protein